MHAPHHKTRAKQAALVLPAKVPPPATPPAAEKMETKREGNPIDVPSSSPPSLGTANLRQEIDAVFRSIDAEWKRLDDARKALEKERSEFEEMKAKHAAYHLPDRIKLSIGGTIFATSLVNLKRDPNSMLAAWFSGNGFDMTPDDDGCYFIDRDGTHFNYIISYLRSGEINLPDDEGTLTLLQKEVDFYQLKDLSAAISDALYSSFKGSTILTHSWCSLLEKWTNSSPQKKWELLYKSTAEEENDLGSACFSACAGKGEVIIVVRTAQREVIGGYTRVGFDVARERRVFGPVVVIPTFSNDPTAFLFSLSPKLQKYACTSATHALSQSMGIQFGQQDFMLQGNNVYSYGSGVYNLSNCVLLGGRNCDRVTELEAFVQI